jgi:BlaI family transcriptional regulator, penicillinase repressor
MSRKPWGKPTESELAILQVLWRLGPVTVREVHELLQSDVQNTGYTTTLKLMQLMHGKGLVIRDETLRAHIYAASMPKSQIDHSLLADLTTRLFGGSSQKLVLQALGAGQPATRGELDEIRALLDQLEQKL